MSNLRKKLSDSAIKVTLGYDSEIWKGVPPSRMPIGLPDKTLYCYDLDKLEALLAEEIQKANKKCRFCGLYDNQVDTVMRNIDKDTRLDEMNRMLEKLKSGKWKSFATEVKDRIKQLEKGEK